MSERVRMLLLLKRKVGMSHEEFVQYWVEEHAPLFASLQIVQRNVLKYELVSIFD